jgi:hypothetical protein
LGIVARSGKDFVKFLLRDFFGIPQTPSTQKVTSDVCAKAEPEISNKRPIKSFFILVEWILKEGVGFDGSVGQGI